MKIFNQKVKETNKQKEKMKWKKLFTVMKLFSLQWNVSFMDIHREKVPSNKTPALTESTIMGIWVVGTSINSLE